MLGAHTELLDTNVLELEKLGGIGVEALSDGYRRHKAGVWVDTLAVVGGECALSRVVHSMLLMMG